MSIFDTAKIEIKELVDLAKFIERFDREIMTPGGINPTEIALKRRRDYEKRYIVLLKKYT